MKFYRYQTAFDKVNDLAPVQTKCSTRQKFTMDQNQLCSRLDRIRTKLSEIERRKELIDVRQDSIDDLAYKTISQMNLLHGRLTTLQSVIELDQKYRYELEEFRASVFKSPNVMITVEFVDKVPIEDSPSSVKDDNEECSTEEDMSVIENLTYELEKPNQK